MKPNSNTPAMDSDHESSCSSFTVPDSRRSWISDVSFGSCSSVSVRSTAGGELPGTRFPTGYKPHKANQAEWEAIRRVGSSSIPVGLDHFRLVRRLGSGDLGNVYLCQLRDPRASPCLYAMKVVDRDSLAVRKKLHRAEIEREILRSLDHPFLPTLYADFDASNYSCLVMEFCPGGDLHVARQRQPGRRFPLPSAKFYAAETILALEYLHMMGIVYRDLKPENVLIREDGHIMLSDFDLSFKCDVIPKLLREKLVVIRPSATSCVPPMQPVLSCFYGGIGRGQRRDKAASAEEGEGGCRVFHTELVAEPVAARSKSFVGTHEYLAPEVISGAGHGSAVDWWTLGVFLYEMIYGRTPFKGEDNEKTLVNIMKQPLSFPKAAVSTNRDSEELLRTAQDLIGKLLAKNPKRRIGNLKGSAEIKRHEFFKGVNWALIRSVKPPEVPRKQGKPLSRKPPAVQKLGKIEKEEPFQIPHHFDYF
ncbi:hypothetical protein HPP92_021442 [Vanilla planifolia]|uniref:non-specific serine/threonine protein kinase n=1 Tax=Vanilla planifolia TaxID=51239 RepID=A0A835PYP7_VANPL|nr:hypothetical protein HPP92_021442 [Vanilla planifolia]